MYEFTRTNDGLIQFSGPISLADLWQAAECLFAEKMHGESFRDPQQAKDYVTARIGLSEREEFLVIFLSTRHRVIASEVMFQGTLDGASVHPREVVRRALALNAACVVIAHNHPSAVCEPSAADISITSRIRDALALVDIRLLDHFIVSGTSALSLAARGHI